MNARIAALAAAVFACLLAATPAPAWAQQSPNSRDQMQMSFAPLVKRVSPAVVNIYARTRVKQEVPPFLRFLRRRVSCASCPRSGSRTRSARA